MTLCEKCGAGGDDITEEYSNGTHTWFRCLKCGKMRALRAQAPRGRRDLDIGLIEHEIVECAGEIVLCDECGHHPSKHSTNPYDHYCTDGDCDCGHRQGRYSRRPPWRK